MAEDEKTVSIRMDGSDKIETIKRKRPLQILCSENGTVFACHENKAENIGKVQRDQQEAS